MALRSPRGPVYRGGSILLAVTALSFCAPPSIRAEARSLLGAAGASPSRIDSLWNAGERDSSQAALARLLQRARASRDRSLILALLLRDGAHRVSLGDVERAESSLREARLIATAVGDSASLCSAVRWLSVAVGGQGRMEEAHGLYVFLRDLARGRGDLDHEGWAEVGLAWEKWTRGDGEGAREGYHRAIELFARIGNLEGEIWSRNGLGTALSSVGAFDEARACYAATAELAARHGNAMVEAMAWNNLGSLEFNLGDPGRAAESFGRAYDLHRRTGQQREAMYPALNIATCLIYLGRYSDAITRLRDLESLCREVNYQDMFGKVLYKQGEIEALQHHPHAAAGFFRRTLALGSALSFENRVETLIGLSDALATMDSSAAALEVLEEAHPLFAGRMAGLPDLQYRARLGEQLLACGRCAEAHRLLRRAGTDAATAGLEVHRVSILALDARALRCLDHPDSALARLDEAAASWEAERSLPLDPEWREQRGESGHVVYTELADILLGKAAAGESPPSPERIRIAFDRLQPFKARTLEERIRGLGKPPGDRDADSGGGRASIRIAELQERVLHDGEIFLDAYLGPRASFLFAVTQNDCKVERLPPEPVLREKLKLLTGLLGGPPIAGPSTRGIGDDDRALPTPDADPRTLAAERSMTRTLLGGIAEMVERSTRIIVAPDGAFNVLPCAALLMWREGAGGSRPLVESVECTQVPSASVLALLRDRGRGSDPRGGSGAPRILAIAGPDTGGAKVLNGAVIEVRHLSRRYVGVDARLPSARRALDLQSLASYAVLHVAGHVRVDDENPWRSRIELGAADLAELLTAARIASMRLPLRLAVLSGCRSAGGRVLSGEGVQGLSGAFLSAGADAVLATLWPVDDLSTAAFMDLFYAALADGRTAVAALREAQMSLRSDPAAAAPYYWAGFVVVGDGDIRVPIERRRNRTYLVVLVVLLACATVWSAARRSRRAIGS